MLKMICNHCKRKFLYEKTFIADLDPDIISDDYYIICKDCEMTDQSYSAYRFDNFTVLEDQSDDNN